MRVARRAGTRGSWDPSLLGRIGDIERRGRAGASRVAVEQTDGLRDGLAPRVWAGDRVDAEVGYALPVGTRFVGTPRVGLTTSPYGRDYRTGHPRLVNVRQTLRWIAGESPAGGKE